MRFISAIYVSSALFLAAWAAPVASAPGAIAEARENFDTVAEARSGSDVFAALDLTAREEIEVELRAATEDPGDRDPQGSGCIIA